MVTDGRGKSSISEICDFSLSLSSSIAHRISPRCDEHVRMANTTLRLPACMVLIAPVGASHASGMVPNRKYFSETYKLHK